MNAPPQPLGPWRPQVILVAALLVPGLGQVLNKMPMRGLVFVFYMLVLGVATYHLTTLGHSFIGRFAGGIAIYVLSVLDAYQWARRTFNARPKPLSQDAGAGARR